MPSDSASASGGRLSQSNIDLFRTRRPLQRTRYFARNTAYLYWVGPIVRLQVHQEFGILAILVQYYVNIIPDASGTASMLPALTGRGQRRSARQRKEIERVYLWDVKSIHGGGLIYQSVRARDDQSGAVAQRARH